MKLELVLYSPRRDRLVVLHFTEFDYDENEWRAAIHTSIPDVGDNFFEQVQYLGIQGVDDWVYVGVV